MPGILRAHTPCSEDSDSEQVSFYSPPYTNPQPAQPSFVVPPPPPSFFNRYGPTQSSPFYGPFSFPFADRNPLSPSPSDTDTSLASLSGSDSDTDSDSDSYPSVRPTVIPLLESTPQSRSISPTPSPIHRPGPLPLSSSPSPPLSPLRLPDPVMSHEPELPSPLLGITLGLDDNEAQPESLTLPNADSAPQPDPIDSDSESDSFTDIRASETEVGSDNNEPTEGVLPTTDDMPNPIQISRNVDVQVESSTAIEHMNAALQPYFHPDYSPSENDDDDSSQSDSIIILSDLVRVAEASRLRRRGAVRLVQHQTHGFAPAGSQGLGLRYQDVFGSVSSIGGRRRRERPAYLTPPRTRRSQAPSPLASSSVSRSVPPDSQPNPLLFSPTDSDSENSSVNHPSVIQNALDQHENSVDRNDTTEDPTWFGMYRLRPRSVESLDSTESREDVDEYTLVCGGSCTKANATDACKSSPLPLAPSSKSITTFSPSPLPLAPSSKSITTFSASPLPLVPSFKSITTFSPTPKPSLTNGCGAVIHVRATLRRATDSYDSSIEDFVSYHSDVDDEYAPSYAWIAKSRATENVVKTGQDYLDWDEVDRTRCIRPASNSTSARGTVVGPTDCGCLREVVGCKNCGNILGIRYIPCPTAIETIHQQRRSGSLPLSRSPYPPAIPSTRPTPHSPPSGSLVRRNLPRTINRISARHLPTPASPTTESANTPPKTRSLSPLRPEGPRYWDAGRQTMGQQDRMARDGPEHDDVAGGVEDDEYDADADADADGEKYESDGVQRGDSRRGYHYYTFFGPSVSGRMNEETRNPTGGAEERVEGGRVSSRMLRRRTPWNQRRVDDDNTEAPASAFRQAVMSLEGDTEVEDDAHDNDSDDIHNSINDTQTYVSSNLFDDTRFRSHSPTPFSALIRPHLQLLRPPLRRSDDNHRSESDIGSLVPPSAFIPTRIRAPLARSNSEAYAYDVAYAQGRPPPPPILPSVSIRGRPGPRRRRLEFDAIPWERRGFDVSSASHLESRLRSRANLLEGMGREGEVAEPFIPPRAARGGDDAGSGSTTSTA